jgi:hypothetical protein
MRVDDAASNICPALSQGSDQQEEGRGDREGGARQGGRGLHSSTFQLNLSRS